MKYLILSLLFSCNLYAGGLFLEPFVSGEAGGVSQDINWSDGYKTSIEGTLLGGQYGVRLGYAWSVFFLGLQAGGASGKYKDIKYTTTDNLTGEVINRYSIEGDIDYEKSEFGLVIGWKMGKVFRMWVESLAIITDTENTDGTKTRYEGFKGLLGFGWNIANGFSITTGLGGSSYFEEDGREYPYNVNIDGITATVDEATEGFVTLGLSFAFGMYD